MGMMEPLWIHTIGGAYHMERGQPEGLSYSHICTQPSIRIAEGGKFLHLKSAEIQSKGEYDGKKRGKIQDFSAKSRSRLQRKLATINEFDATLPDFLTLTYPGEYSEDWHDWKKHLHAFNMALVRRWPSVWGLWRLEFQQRGAPHYHFLLWEGPEVEGEQVWSVNEQRAMVVAKSGSRSPHNAEIFEWMSRTWYRIVGSGDPKHLAAGTRIEPIQSWNGVVYYASKYLAKLPDGKFAPVEYTGRFWGVVQKDRWKVNFFDHELEPRVFYKIRRVLRKRHQKRFGGGKRHKRAGWSFKGMHAFIDSVQAFKLLNWAYLQASAECPF